MIAQQKQYALVTGAAGGIGKACARALHADGWKVIAADRHFPDGHDDSYSLAITLDLSDNTALRTQIDSLVTDYELDCVVNCAGITDVSPFLKQDPKKWQALLNINYLAPLTICQAVLPAMIARNSGTIIQITSDAARTGAGREAVYAGSKNALVAFSKSIAQEVGAHGVRVNCVSPGVILTPMSAPNKDLLEKFAKRVPMKRLGQADDVAGAVRFLADAESCYITGQVISVGGGLTMVD